jgi:hypothetical protein
MIMTLPFVRRECVVTMTLPIRSLSALAWLARLSADIVGYELLATNVIGYEID